jgi:hypothetical protein
MTRVAARRDVDLVAGHRRPCGDVAEVALRLLFGGGDVDVARQHQRGVGRAVILAEPVLGLLHRRALQKVARRHVGRVVGMPLGKARREDTVEDLAVGLVLALALLVLHHTALFVDGLLVERAQQVAHAVGFHPERAIERRGGHVLEIVGAVGAGGAVLVGGADLLEGLEELAAVVLGTLEHQVLEPVRELLPVGGLVLAAHVVPDVDRDDRRLAVGVHDDGEPIVEPEALEGDVRVRGAQGHGGEAEDEQGGKEGDRAHG